MQKKLTKAQKEKRREYQRTRYHKLRAAKSAIPTSSAPPNNIEAILNAYYTLTSFTSDAEVKDELSRMLGIIILENSKN